MQNYYIFLFVPLWDFPWKSFGRNGRWRWCNPPLPNMMESLVFGRSPSVTEKKERRKITVHWGRAPYRRKSTLLPEVDWHLGNSFRTQSDTQNCKPYNVNVIIRLPVVVRGIFSTFCGYKSVVFSCGETRSPRVRCYSSSRSIGPCAEHRYERFCASSHPLSLN